MSTVALQGVFDQILATFDLTAANKRWLAAQFDLKILLSGTPAANRKNKPAN
jgi:hypothetical protein